MERITKEELDNLKALGDKFVDARVAYNSYYNSLLKKYRTTVINILTGIIKRQKRNG